MKYTYPPEEYMRQLRAYNALEAMRFSPEDSREYVIAKLEERSAKKRAIAGVANTMIREYVETFESAPDSLTPEDAGALMAFLEMLIPDGVVKDLVTDYGIALRIARILAAYYRRQEDWNRYAIALNRCFLGYQLLVNAHSCALQDSPYVEESIALAHWLDADGFDARSRSKALLSLTYAPYMGDDRFPTERFRTINDILLSHMQQPPTAFEEAVLGSLYCNILDHFQQHCIYAHDHDAQVDLAGARPFLEGLIAWLQERQAQERTFGLDPNIIRAHLIISDFFLGNIPAQALLDGLTAMQRTAAGSADPWQQVFGLALLNYYYLIILNKFSALPKAQIDRLSRERIREVMPKLKSVSHIVNNVYFNRYIFQFLNAASLTGSFDDCAEVILDTTVYADKPLYIHTVMVRQISRAIFDTMIEQMPEAFDGVAGRDAAYIRAHPAEMRQLLSDCCMFHDIGKFFILDIVENSMRRLTKEEFRLIRDHPGNFENIYRASGVQDERVRCIRDCALAHHVWHDGTRGYPDVPRTKNRPFVDILAIADGIDAATDFLGRPYKPGKTLEQLIGEFRAGAGTQYGPEAVSALSDPALQERLRYLIGDGRREINYQIYAFNEIREDP